MKYSPLPNWLQWIALGIMAIYAAFWAVYSAGEILAGDLSGIVYLVPVVIILGLMLLGWKLPVIGGLIAQVIGVLLFLRVYTSMPLPEDKISASLVVGGPFVIAGLLFIFSSLLPNSTSSLPDAELQTDQPS